MFVRVRFHCESRFYLLFVFVFLILVLFVLVVVFVFDDDDVGIKGDHTKCLWMG